jgi:hypothetical protein
MKHVFRSRLWLAALSIGGFLACSGKLNVGQPGATAGSGGTVGGHAAGGNGSGSGGSSSKPPPITNVGNPATCPGTIPTPGDSCDLERAACGYGPATGSLDVTYTQCVCGERAAGDLRWDCRATGSSYASCPATVENGSNCFGHYATVCQYPVSIQCECAPNAGVWDCVRRTSAPWDVPAPPTMPDPQSPINSLSDADRTAWCRWFQDAVFGPGFPPVPDSEVGPDGKTQNGSCEYAYGAACNVAIVALSPRQCAQNLAVSACAAPIGDLTDCVTTARSECLPSPHGCARYLAQGCSGTIVSDLGPQNTGGDVPTAGSGPTPAAGSGPTPTAGTGSSSGGTTSVDFSSPCSVQVE